jgi:MFS family permease
MKTLGILSVGNFFATVHFFLIIYIIVPYLATLMPASVAGLSISLGAIITLSLFPFMPALVRRYSPQRIAVIFSILEAGVLVALSLSPTALPAMLLCALAVALSPLISYQLDVLLESATENEKETGRVRTIFLTAQNSALVMAPLIIGYLLGYTDTYARVFLCAALSLLPFIFLMGIKKLPHRVLRTYTNVSDSLMCLLQDKDLRSIALSNATLQFFYHLAPLYVPLYLHSSIGLPWSTLGWVFALMLVPFVLLEYPAGYLADRYIGDKKFLAVGFILMGISFALTGFITMQTSLSTIVILLIVTRIGAALVEAMTESHFFRRVSDDDINTVGIFRMTRPGAALLAPLIGTLILSVSTFTIFFICAGALIVSIGLYSALSIQDIR